MHAILNKLLYEQENRRSAVLVTVIREEGSAPRGLGASMLVGEKGRLVGSIGGGAVERNSEQLAVQLLAEGRSDRKKFELHPTGKDIGMVCGGDVEVFFRFIAWNDALWTAIAKDALGHIGRKESCLLILDLEGNGPDTLVPDAPSGFSKDGTRFGILISPGERAILFGAGHISRALTPVLSSVGFLVTVIDQRPELAVPEAFPAADRVICGDFSRIDELITITSGDYLVVMTQGHTFDYMVEEQILRGPFAYCGVIGSATKHAVVNQKLLEAGIREEVIAKIHAPVGLKIRAITPEEIAVSIASEMILERAKRREAEGTNEK